MTLEERTLSMESSLSSLLDFYVFPTGRRLFAMRRVAKRAKAAGFTDLVKHCNAAVAHDRACLALERTWAGVAAEARGKGPARPSTASPTAAQLDPLVDRALTGIRDHAQSQAAGAVPDDPIHATVAGFLKEVFPAGVQEVTALPYVEELEAVDDILGKLRGPSLSPVVTELGLGRLVKRLASLAEQYRAALEAPTSETLAFGKVKAARAEGQERLLQAVAIILGRHHRSTVTDVAARAHLLGPILEQNDAIGAAMRARSTVGDIDAETGEPDPAGTAPIPEPTAEEKDA
jgi:Na+-transporting methylmalonyl-CoA/oxaloacetate decarboxylase gamma subunit